ncbi:MAG: isoleucine--tRNA ligase [Actinomycetota bacterium]|nr:isoleucine--tRNA ligase [Actinomycetota bacterium]
MEHEVLARWRDRKVFERSLAQTQDGPLWVFYEGPPTANGKPGTHHVEARVFKDLFPRFKTMKGFHVPRRAGWDCHGLPVELAVEKELGFTGKKDIEAYGIAEFNAKCRESVERHVHAFEEMTERMAYWVDMSQAYRTMDTTYIESVWWSLKQIWDKGLLVEDHRVAPYCPRCGTALSDHEVALGYLTVTDPSVFVRFPVTSGPLADLGAALLVWTTTPWTLVSNTAVAVHPDVTYVVARIAGEVLVVAEPLLARVAGEAPVEVLQRLTGADLEHTEYTRPFDFLDFDGQRAHFVGLATYVTVEDGTGLVHQAPAFGAEDLAVARLYDLPVINPVRPDGRFDEHLPVVGGKFFKDADAPLVDDLRARGLLYRYESYEHSYPHCWRCDTALLYYALPSWYIKTTLVKDRLIEENEKTDWHPPGIKHGRYGDWLRNNVDWALSRDRYWGTPLPLWRCSDDHITCVGSLAELSELTGRDVTGVDPHRPFIDEVGFDCPQCGEPTTRVRPVIDGWYDSGSMPFAQWGAPYRNNAEFQRAYPAQFICEALDQTRGWFYTLMVIGTIVFDRSSYETVLCLGHLMAEDGRKMSKHLGNILEPMPVMDRHGADALRWFMLVSGSPWAPRRIGHQVLEEIVRKVLLTYWNTAAFQSLYARVNDWSPEQGPWPDLADRPVLDRWLISELHSLVIEVDTALEDFDSQVAGRRLAQFVDDLSNWYVRRSRRRFWDGDASALATLHEALYVLTLLLAPFIPFVTDRVWQAMIHSVWPDQPDSVHLAAWPRVDGALIDEQLSDQMALLRRVVDLGRSARAEAAVRTRQPLQSMVVFAAGWAELPEELRALAREELNVVGEATLDELTDVIDRVAKPNFRTLGRRFGSQTREVAAAIAAADVTSLLSDGATVRVGTEDVTVEPDDFTVTEAPRQGWTVAGETGLTVALDVRMTPELRRAGFAREVVRLIQEARKTSGLDVADRIELWWEAAAGDVAEALAEHEELVAGEVLAVSVTRGRPAADIKPHADVDLGLTFWLRAAGG